MNPVQTLRQTAVLDFSKITHPEFGLLASGAGRFQNFFSRDAYTSAIFILSHDQKELTEAAISAVVKAQELGTSYLGKTINPATGEKRGLIPHEIHTSSSPQERLIELSVNFPVFKYPDGKMGMVNYFADDVNALFRISVAIVADTLFRTQTYEEAKIYLSKMWPFVYQTLEYDFTFGDLDGDGLLESAPKGPLLNPNWKDSNDAYINEKGEVPVGPYKFLNNNCLYLWSLRKSFNMASNLGFEDFSKELERKYRKGVSLLHNLFWMEKEEYFSPLIDGNGKQLEMIGDDTLEGLWGEIFYPEYAANVISRIKRPDMLSAYGIRTRSLKCPAGEGYHRKTVWGHRTPMAAEGAMKYGYTKSAFEFDTCSLNLVQAKGAVELVRVSDSGELFDYEENGIPAACSPQAWHVGALLARSAS